MIAATLSIFHGPRVESSFSMMTEVIGTKSGRLNIGTYDAILTVKYSPMAMFECFQSWKTSIVPSGSYEKYSRL